MFHDQKETAREMGAERWNIEYAFLYAFETSSGEKEKEWEREGKERGSEAFH